MLAASSRAKSKARRARGKEQKVDSSIKCNSENVPSLQRSEMFIVRGLVISPRSVRSEISGEFQNIALLRSAERREKMGL